MQQIQVHLPSHLQRHQMTHEVTGLSFHVFQFLNNSLYRGLISPCTEVGWRPALVFSMHGKYFSRPNRMHNSNFALLRPLPL
jgi:hypothetical protein